MKISAPKRATVTNAMTSQQQVLAHLGNALLSAQIVERFLALLLAEPEEPRGSGVLEAFAAKAKATRLAALESLLRKIRAEGRSVPELDAELRKFLRQRNKLVHCFQELGRWDFASDRDCNRCVNFLRGFIDRAASLQHLFVSAISVRDVSFGTSVAMNEADRYAHDYRTVYAPLSIRWSSSTGE